MEEDLNTIIRVTGNTITFKTTIEIKTKLLNHYLNNYVIKQKIVRRY